MANERYNVVIGLEFQPGQAVQGAIAARDQIQGVFRQLSSVSIGGFDRAAAERFGAQLRSSIESAFRTDVRNSPLFQSMRPVTQDLVKGTTPTDTSRFLSQQLALTQAELNKARFEARAKLPLGSEGAFPDKVARYDAEIASTKRLNDANLALERAKRVYAEQVAREATQEQSAERRGQEAIGRATVAIQRRADAEAAATTRYIASFGRQINASIAAAERAERDQRREEEARGRGILAIERRSAQETSAQRREEEARGRAALAITRRQAAEDAATTRYIASFGRQINAALAAQRKEEEGRARATVAINRRTEQEETASRRAQEALGREINAILKRTAAEEKAAQAVQERAAAAASADRAARNFSVSYPNAGASTTIGRSQVSVNNAERVLEVASLSLASLRTAETRTAEQLLAGERRVEAATATLAAARERLATAEARSADSGLLSQFHTGFKGQSDRPYAEQIGQALKFSLFYGTAYKLLFAFTQTLQQTLQEGIAFQQAFTELKLSAGDANKNLDALAERLGQSSTEAGFAPSQGVLVGARSLGLFGATEAPPDTQAQVAEISARVVSRLALSSGQQPADLQTNIAAIVQAFGGGAQAQYRVADLDAYMAHRFGVAPGSTIAAVSEAGTVGRAAGFNQEEVNAIAADLMARTGQTAPAVAGFMAQIFSRGGEGSLTNIAGKYGIDPTLELSQQIKELAKVYRDASPQDRAQLSAAFGRGKVQNAAIALLQDYDSVQQAATAARGGAAAGAADKSFAERMGNIGGQIAATTGVLKEFANQLGQSGLLDILGVGIVVFRELVSAGTGLLRIWNSLNRGIRDVILALALLSAGAKVAGGATFIEGMLGRTGITRAAVPFAAAAGSGRLMAATAAGEMVPLASRAGVRAGFGAIAGSLLNPATIAIAGLVAVGALKNTSDKLRNAQDFATKTLSEGIPAPGATSDDYRSRATALREAATAQRDAVSGLWSSRVAMVTGQYFSTTDSASRLENQATTDEIVAKAVDRWSAERASKADPTLISGFDSTSLADSMTQITNAGGTAADRMRVLSQAIRGTGTAAEGAAQAFDPGQFAVQAQEGILGALTGALSGVKMRNVLDGTNIEVPDLNAPFGIGSHMSDTTDAWIRDTFDPASVMRSLRSRIGKTNLGTASTQDLDRIASGVLDDSGLDLSGDDLIKAHDAVVKFLQEQQNRIRALMDGAKELTGPEVTAAVNQLVSDAAESASTLQDTDLAGKVQNARNLVRQILAVIARSADAQGSAQAQLQLDIARRALAQSQFDELEQMRKVAQQNARSKAEVARIGAQFMRREIRAAVRGGNSDVLANIIAQAGKGSIDVARKVIQDAIDAVKAALAVKVQVDAIRNKFDSDLGVVVFGQSQDTIDQSANRKRLRRLQQMLDALGGDLTAGDKAGDVYKTGSDVPGYDGSAAAAQETRAEREAALAAANAVRSGSAVAAARADIQSARAAIAKADKNSVAYYQALGQLYTAQQALADAILERARDRMLLGIDMTNPLAMARVDLNAARRKLAADRRSGKSQEVLDADRIAVRNAEASREATAFQQRLDSVTTADQLGRISHQKYLNYLNSEHNRLESIKHRTFQQQQELDQIDGLLKEAASAMDAQWNFGDIKLPTPYQVRRYIEQTSGGRGAQDAQLAARAGTTVSNTATIYIDGAETAKVKRIVTEVLGQGYRTRTAQPRRR